MEFNIQIDIEPEPGRWTNESIWKNNTKHKKYGMKSRAIRYKEQRMIIIKKYNTQQTQIHTNTQSTKTNRIIDCHFSVYDRFNMDLMCQIHDHRRGLSNRFCCCCCVLSFFFYRIGFYCVSNLSFASNAFSNAGPK